MKRALILQSVTFLLLIVAIGVVAGGTIILRHDATKSKHLAQRVARALAREQAANNDRRKLRVQQVRALHATAIKGCTDIHKVVKVFETYISRSLTAPSLNLPDLTPRQKKALAHVGIQSHAAERALFAQLEAADCISVKKLPTSAIKPKGTTG